MNIIAEIGTAHGGSLEKAYSLIDAAVESGADSIKFQWVYADEILHPDTGFVKLPGGNIRLYDRFRQLEVEPQFFEKCLEYTHSKGARFVCSPFGMRSLHELCDIHPDAIKIASPEVNYVQLLEETVECAKGVPVILSSGVSRYEDLDAAVSILKKNPLTVLHCITSYPAPENEYNVMCVKTFKERYGVETGISDHSLSPILVPVLTTAFGGSAIEKHITLSKKTDGLDDPVALEPEEFATMVHCVHQTEAVLNRWNKESAASGNDLSSDCLNEIINQLAEQFGIQKVLEACGDGIKTLAPSEEANYGRTNRSLHYMNSFEKGHVIVREDIGILRTEKILTPGIAPSRLNDVLGKTLTRTVTSGEGVQEGDW